MTAVLEVVTGDLAGRAYAIDELPFTIGRKETCSIVLPKKFVSRTHAEIVRPAGDAGSLLLRGLSGKNPIFVAGAEVSEHGLRDGDEFEIGDIRFRFRAQGDGASRAARAAERLSSTNGESGKNGERRASDESGEPGTQRFQRGTSSVPDEETARARRPLDPPSAPPGIESAKRVDESDATGDLDVRKAAREARDPFAVAEPRASRTPASAAAQERFLRGLVAAGVLAILAALAVVAWVSRPEPPVVLQVALSPPVAPGEVRHYEESWSEQDPPRVLDGLRSSSPGEPLDLVRAADERVARVEWVVPETRSVAHFLVSGVSPGRTTFEVKQRSGSSRVYAIVVSGASPHEQKRRARDERLAALASAELKALIRKRLAQGEALEGRVDAPRHERDLRRIVREYDRAAEALERLKTVTSQSGDLDPDLSQASDAVREHQERARDVWRKAREIAKQRYDACVRRAQWDDAARELQVLLALSGDRCDGDFQRWLLLLEKWYQPRGHYQGRFEDPGCIEAEE